MHSATSGVTSSKISTRIRTMGEIYNQKLDLDALYNKKHNIVKKILLRQSTKSNLLTWLIVSLLFYLVAELGAIVDKSDLSQFFSIANGQAIDFIYMPIYLFVHLFTVSALTLAIKKSITTLPSVMDIPTDRFENAIKRFESNLAPLLIALPFILFDTYDILIKDIQTGTFQYISLLPELVLTFSWIVEWLIFGNIVWLMAYYIIFVRHITKKYSYDSELLNVVLNDELRPIVHVGYEQSIVVSVFLALNIYYTIYTGFYPTDFIASLIIFILLPLIAMLPLRYVHKDLTNEIKVFTEKKVEHMVNITRTFFVGQDMAIDQKIDYILTDRILFRLKQIHKSHSNKMVYLRILGTMAVPAAGYYVDYGRQVTVTINQTLHINLPFIQLFHLLINYLLLFKIV